MRVDERRGDGLARRLAAPQHELEHGVEPFALLNGGLGDRLRLLDAEALPFAGVEDRRMAEDDQPGARPHFKMAEPQLLVHQAQRFIDGPPLLGGHLDVWKGEELQHLVLRAPHATKLVLRPAACGGGDDFTLGGALACPAASLEILLERFDRRAVVALVVGFFLAQVHAPGLALGPVDLAPPARFAVVVPAAGPATLASSAAMRAFRISFSSRAAAAMAFTASNSSRPTKSCPPIHALNFSRADASASRPMPAKVPAKPFTIFAKSSNIRFSDCMSVPPFRTSK